MNTRRKTLCHSEIENFFNELAVDGKGSSANCKQVGKSRKRRTTLMIDQFDENEPYENECEGIDIFEIEEARKLDTVLQIKPTVDECVDLKGILSFWYVNFGMESVNRHI
jgi:hypothetical protein